MHIAKPARGSRHYDSQKTKLTDRTSAHSGNTQRISRPYDGQTDNEIETDNESDDERANYSEPMNELPSYTATQLKNETGTVLDRAMSGPVRLTSHGRARVYIVPAETFERLMALEEAELVRRANAARKRGMIGPDASMALLKGLTDASRKPVARRGESAAARPREAPRAAGKKATRAKRKPAS